MKKSRIFSIAAICFSLCFSLFPKSGKAFAEEKKTLDVYVILGSDEAVGNARFSSLSESDRKQSFEDGIENVYYYGSAAGNSCVDAFCQVKSGFGSTVSHFGAELGLADYLSQSADGEKLIFKYAEDGASLTDGWASPSLRDGGDGEASWNQAYDEFVDMFADMVTVYEDNGYTLRLQGTAWLGERETDGRFASFLDDLRKEYAAKGLRNASTAPFVVGNAEGLNEIFKKRGFVHKLGDGIFPTDDDPTKIMRLGREIGKTICKEAKKPSLLVYSSGKGACDVENPTFENDGAAIVTFTPDDGYYLSAVVLNGKKVLSEIENGKLTIEKGTYFLQATFSRRQAYSLSVENDGELGTVSIENAKEKYYEGDEVIFSVSPAEGYAVESVLFNGSKLTAENGAYAVRIQAKANEIVVTYEIEEKETIPPAADDPSTGEGEASTDERKSGCSSALSAISVAPVLLILLLAKRKKR